MARMLGKSHRPLTCEYGCCDWAHGLGRRLVRRGRARERQALRRSLRRTFWGF